MSFLSGVGHGLDEAFFMFWETLWALVLGFALSGAVQAFVSRTEMQQALGDHSPETLAKSSFFGMISSSCSYASSALAKSLFARGADFTASLVFMVASTNLVVELGIVLWLLIGWQFALAEFVGGAIMIILLGLVVPRVIPAAWIERARHNLNRDAASHADPGQHAGHEHHTDTTELEREPLKTRLRSRRGWGDASGYTISDLSMLRKELLIGFVVAGFLAALVPTAFWQSIFLTGHGFASSLENVIIGPFLAIISFVCSVGNVPLAAALWQGGISFGGVVSFVFADLITLPLLSIYRKYFGTAITLRILGVFWVVMSTAGLAVEYLFKTIRIPVPPRPSMIVHTGFQWNYTTVLNIVALAGFAVIYWLYRHRDTTGPQRYAKDPICGMQVEIAHAPATRTRDGQRFYFCSDHCAHRFQANTFGDPATGQRTQDAADRAEEVEATGAGVDPVCGMTIDRQTALHTPGPAGSTVWLLARQAVPSGSALQVAGPPSWPTRNVSTRPSTPPPTTGAERSGMTVTDHEHPIDPERVTHARSRLPTADDVARLTGLLSMMADPVRLRLIYALDVAEELCVGDLALALEVSEDSASYALRLLRSAGLVTTRKQGRIVYNQLARDFPQPLKDTCLRQLITLTHTTDDEPTL